MSAHWRRTEGSGDLCQGEHASEMGIHSSRQDKNSLNDNEIKKKILKIGAHLGSNSLLNRILGSIGFAGGLRSNGILDLKGPLCPNVQLNLNLEILMVL